MQNCNNIKIT